MNIIDNEKLSRYLEVGLKASVMSSRFSLTRDFMNSLSQQNRNRSATRGAQLVPIGIPTFCLLHKNLKDILQCATMMIVNANTLIQKHILMNGLWNASFTYGAKMHRFCFYLIIR